MSLEYFCGQMGKKPAQNLYCVRFCFYASVFWIKWKHMVCCSFTAFPISCSSHQNALSFYCLGSSWNPWSGWDLNCKWNWFGVIRPLGRCSLCANNSLLQKAVFFHRLAPACWLFLVASQTPPTHTGCFIRKIFSKFNRVKLHGSIIFQSWNQMRQSQAKQRQ